MMQNETWMDISSGIPQPSTGDTAAGWETAIVTDPRHGAEKVFHVYEVKIDGVFRRFAGGEFSNGVFGVYLPVD